ncbi:hypothetical protein GGP41_001528 [Bipolaris sorokiniana]|uniref:Uncharacterized protein n=1 Tax=Cochliobolus sativus TaxID=45130 RepID=A0A8H5ZPY6_COCSA|nr:hypothetical protein GGP41_001528 [Bipolaris sorokiniana]
MSRYACIPRQSTILNTNFVTYRTSDSSSSYFSFGFKENEKYPPTPIVLPRNGDSQSYIDRPVNTPEPNEDSTQSMGNIVAKLGGQLQYISTVFTNQNRENQEIREGHYNQYSMAMAPEADPNKLTTAYGSLNRVKSYDDERNEDPYPKIRAPHGKCHGLHSHDLTMSFAQTVSSPIHAEVGASNDLRTQLKTLKVETQVMRSELEALRTLYHSMNICKDTQEAKLKESLQNLALSQNEARSLQTQVQALQKEMLAQVSKVEVISDEAFARDFYALASLVKSLSRTVQPAQDVNVVDVLDPFGLVHRVAKQHWNTRAHKKAYVEAWIWSALIDIIFRNPFSFCEYLTPLYDTWRFLFGREFTSNWPKPTPQSENWRCITMKKLFGDIEIRNVIAGQNYGEHPALDKDVFDLQKGVFKKRKFTVDIIRSYLAAVTPKSDLFHIPEIVDRAFVLAVNMSMQPFRVQVTWPHVGVDYEANCMSPIPDRNGEDIHEGVVAFVANPGLTRWGDVHGRNFEMCYEIVPSLVQLEPVQAKHRDLRSRVVIKQEEEYA